MMLDRTTRAAPRGKSAGNRPSPSPGRPLTRASVLQLQRALGNRAFGAAVRSGAFAPPPTRAIARDITVTAKDLTDAGRPKRGRGKWDHIVATLGRYAGERRAEARWEMAYEMLVSVGRWLRKHRDRDVATSYLETLHAELLQEVLVAGKQGRYMEDAAKQELGSPGPFRHMITKEGEQAAALTSSAALPHTRPDAGFDRYAQSIATRHSLTDAELSALRTYTAADYAYINAALAGDHAWLKRVLGGKWFTHLYGARDPDAGDLAQVASEASRHSPLAESALSKLDVYDGPAWRGETWWDLNTVLERYEEGRVLDLAHFLSTTKQSGKAFKFAKEGAGPHKLVLSIKVTAGTDVGLLSTVRNEHEVLLAPGAKLKIIRLKKLDDPWWQEPVDEEELQTVPTKAEWMKTWWEADEEKAERKRRSRLTWWMVEAEQVGAAPCQALAARRSSPRNSSSSSFSSSSSSKY